MAALVQKYQLTWISDLLHSFPHFDLTFREVNSTFDLNDQSYRESLLLWTSLPIIWLLLTLILFLFYFCYRCCQRDVERRKNVSCLQWSMACITLLAIATVGVGFFGNEEAKRSVARMSTAAGEAVDNIGLIQTQVSKLDSAINMTVTSGVQAVNLVFINSRELPSGVRQDLVQKAKETLNVAEQVLVKDSTGKLITTELKSGIGVFKEYAYYRWLGTTASLCWLTLLCLLLLLGIIRTSKCTLLMFCTFGIFSLVLCWAAAGAHLGVSVGAADFCASPHDIIEDVGSDFADKEFIRYYLRCTTVEVLNPFKDALQHALGQVQAANNTINSTVTMAYKYIPRDKLSESIQRVYAGLSEAKECITQLLTLSECTTFYKDYSVVIDNLCNTTLFGVVLLTLSCIATGLLFSVLIVMASRAWRNFGVSDHEDTYPKPMTDSADDEGPFLPRPGPSAPLYGSGSSRYAAASSPYGRPGAAQEEYVPYARGNAQVHLALQRQANPPPPYSATEFYHQYNDVVNPAMYAPYAAPGPYAAAPAIRESNA